MHLERALRFDNRANLETLATLKSSDAPSEAVDILAHTVAVSQLWLSRATGTPRPSYESVPSPPNPQQVETAVQPSMVPAESLQSRNTGIIPRKASN
jgi:hypothetical protein